MWFFKFIGLILIEIVKPIVDFLCYIYLLIASLLKLLFYGPIILISNAFLYLKDVMFSGWIFIKSVFLPGVTAAKNIAPVAKRTAKNKKAAKSLI